MSKFDNIFDKLLDWVLGVVGIVFVTLIFGSYGYVWLIDYNQTKEKEDWRNKHIDNHKQELSEIKKDINSSVSELKEELKANQRELKDLFEKMIRVQERYENFNKYKERR